MTGRPLTALGVLLAAVWSVVAHAQPAQATTPTITVTRLVPHLDIPWDLAFTPDGTMLFTERGGKLSVRLTDGTVRAVTADFSDLFVQSESGLMALVVGPQFATTRRFYTCQAHTGPEVQVIAWTMNDDYTAAARVNDPLVGAIPADDNGWHSGCRLRFGPDGYLWITTGDALSATVPQDLDSLGGKVLRVDASTGAGAPGNPFPSSPLIYTYGHRNVQGLARRPGTRQMWAVEHGPEGYDEINLLSAAGNYGWDPVPATPTDPDYNENAPMTDLTKYPGAIKEKWSSGEPPGLAPSGGIFLEGAAWGAWEGRLAVATLRGKSLRLFEFTAAGTLVSQLVVRELNGTYDRLRTPMLGPDGALYVTTSSVGVDQILKIVPTLPPPRPPGGGGGGGGTRTPSDRHGDTPAAATPLNPRRYTTGVMQRTLTAHLQSRRDVDYFQVTLPYAGVLTAHTTGADTTGRLYQVQADGAPLLVAEDTDSGRSSNFALGTAVAADTYYLAVSAGRGSGEYRLSVHYTPAFVDNPGPDSPQSGVSVLSGWVCDAERVEIEFETPGAEPQTWVPATGTSRPDTAVACGSRTTDTGYGLLFNWNRLGDGEHTVRVVIDDVVFTERQITVTTLGEHPDQEFRRDLAASTDIPDFPAMGETTTLRWQTARQNFVIASGAGGGGGAQLTPTQAWLGIPPPGSFQSGIGVLSGWVCEADTVELVFEPATGEPFTEEAGYGTERLDTEGVCGDTDNGFGLLFNWNRLGDGQHTVRALADREEFAHSTFTVTTLGEAFAENLARTHAIEDFPAEGQTTTVEWQTGQQNFVIIGVE